MTDQKHDKQNADKQADDAAEKKYLFAGRAADGYTIGLNLFVSVGVGAAMGLGLDKLFNTLPLFLIIFMILGFAAGLRTLWRAMSNPPVSSQTSDDDHNK